MTWKTLEIVRWASEQRTPDMKSALVLRALALHADAHGICWPGKAQIAQLANGMPTKSVKRAIDELVDAGLIECASRGRRKDGLHRSNEYRLKLPEKKAGERQGSGVTRTLPLMSVLDGGAKSSGVTETLPPEEGVGSGSPHPVGSQRPQVGSPGPQVGSKRPPVMRTVQEQSRNLDLAATPKGALREGLILELRKALAEACGSSLASMTKRARDTNSIAAREIFDAGGRAADVAERATQWPRVFPDATITDLAISKHWSRLKAPRGPSPVAPTPEELERRRERDVAALMAREGVTLERVAGEDLDTFRARVQAAADAKHRARAEADESPLIRGLREKRAARRA